MAVPPVVTPTVAEAVPSGWGEAATGVRGLPRALALDRGRPRIAHQTRSGVVGYAWCDSGCHQASAWRSVELVRTEFFSTPLDLAVDGWGRPHLAYYDIERAGVFYATCEAGCDRASAWTHTRVDDSTNEDGLSLAVDPWGRPRLAYIRSNGASSGLTYAACDAQCTTSSNWSIVIPGHWNNGHPSLALDGTKPRIVTSWPVSGKGEFELRYWTCEHRCLDKSSWQYTTVTNYESIGEPSLAVEGARAHIAFNPIGSTATSLNYVRCESGCTSPENWSDPVLITAPPQRALGPDLAVVNGRPRIAYTLCPGACTIYTYSDDSEVYYASCDADCTLAVKWQTRRIAADPTTWGRLALDGERPRVVYADTSAGVDDLRYASCDAPCGKAGTWPPPPSSPPPSDDSSSSGDPGSGGSPDSDGAVNHPPSGTDQTSDGVSESSADDPGAMGAGRGHSSAHRGPGSATGGERAAATRSEASRWGGRSGGSVAPDRGAVGDGASGSPESPNSILDLVAHPASILSWRWAAIALKVLAGALLAAVGWLTYWELAHRRASHRTLTADPRRGRSV